MTTLPQQSLAAVTAAPNVMELRRMDVPEIGDDAAIVRIEATGICGTDCEWFRGDLDVPYPIILGHELLGRIAAIGSRAAAVGRGRPGGGARRVRPVRLSLVPAAADAGKPGWTKLPAGGAATRNTCTGRPAQWCFPGTPTWTRR